mgnify:CR=1 FL=1
MTEEKQEAKNKVILERYGASFSIPEKIGVRTALQYWSIVTAAFNTEYRLVKQWEACVTCGLLEDWECEAFPDPTIPLSEVSAEDEMLVAQLIMNVTTEVQMHMNRIRSVEKN